MKIMRTIVAPVLIAGLGAGCAANKQALQQGESAQQRRTNEIMEQVDRNAASLRNTNAELSAIAQRLNELETRIETALADQTADVQEIKENLSFMNDQIRRLDNSLQTRPPAVSRPGAAEVFRPGGFDIEAAYKGALNEYYAKRYETAVAGFTEILTVAPASALADNAQYWIGESYYGMNNYSKALEAFQKVFDFPKSNKLADSHYKIGLCHEKLGNTDAAGEEFRAVVQQYPGTSAASLASQKLQ